MCTPSSYVPDGTGLYDGIFKAIGAAGSVVSTISEYKTNKNNYTYRAQVALNNAKMAQNEALKQKQLGIEKARLEKISGLQELSKLQAKNSASNLDMMSKNNILSYQDAISYSNSNANAIKNEYNAKAYDYFNQANNYLNQAKEYKKQYKQSVFDYSLNALGKYSQVADEWYQNIGELT